MGVDADNRSNGSSDYLSILSGTSQNVVGIVIAALATLTAQVMLTRAFGAAGFGVVTVMTQAVFVVSFATRAGMDMAVLRDVAVEVGQGRWHRIRVPVARAATVALGVSVAVAIAGVLAAGPIRRLFSFDAEEGKWVVQAAMVGLPFLGLANVWLSATRGLKIMRYTLYVFWAGQPLTWIVFMLIGWTISKTTWMSVLAYSLSWAAAAAAAWFFWRKESRNWEATPMEAGAMTRLARYAAPRAPAALFSQLLFWTDLFVVTRFVSDVDVGVYSAALRAGQILVLFLTSVNLMFSPFVADLHSRGETARLDRLFKTLTRWTLAATMPAFLLLAVAPATALRVFGSDFAGGRTALLILLAGQFVNIATGSVGFVLIMAGRTGWDLVVYAAALITDLILAFWLADRYGIEGAAIANAVTFALSNSARLVLVKKYVRIWPYDRDYSKLLAPAVVGAGVMWAVHAAVPEGGLTDLVATGGLGFVAYVLAYLAVGLTEAERRGLQGLRARFQAR